MDYNNNINIAHLHAIEESIRYLEKYGNEANYNGLINNINWYWSKSKPYESQEWVLEFIKFLSGTNNEYRI